MTRIRKKERMKTTAGMQVRQKSKVDYEEGPEALKEAAVQERPMSICRQGWDKLQAEVEQQLKERLGKGRTDV